MYLRQCLQEVRVRLGEADLFLKSDGLDVDAREAQERLKQAVVVPAISRTRAFRDYTQHVGAAKREGKQRRSVEAAENWASLFRQA
jgi:hypothetical protein